MRYIVVLIILLILSGCTDNKELILNKELIINNGKKLCSCQDGLWFIEGTMAHCNNGTNFTDVDKITVISVNCPSN